MDKKDCFRLGNLTSTHGIGGGMHCVIDADDPSRYAGLDAVYVDVGGALVRHEVESLNLKGRTPIIRLAGIRTLDDAARLKHCGLYLPLTQLPDPGKNRFYIHEAFGFSVCDRKSGYIGRLHGVVEMPGQSLAQVREGDREWLIPLVKDIIDHIDRNTKTLFVNLPEGLFELYR